MAAPEDKSKRRTSGKHERRPRDIEAELDAELAALDRDVADPSLIPGIYNYCDRWCDRCPLTARCLTYRTEQRRKAEGRPQASDPANEAFWEGVTHDFAVAMQMLEREARKLGIDLATLDASTKAANEARRQRRHAAREGSTLHRSAVQYWKTAQKVLESIQPAVADLDDELAVQARLGVGQPDATIAALSDAFEIIEWYLQFIDVKLQRAVSGKADEPAAAQPTSVARDCDGSAKVALIAIDRSMSAWARVREHIETTHGDAILDLLVQLERLRRSVEAEFPRARAFVRPGFDQPDAPASAG